MKLLNWTWKSLTAPRLPAVACTFSSTHISMAEVRSHHGQRRIEHSSCVEFPPGLLCPSLDGINIPNIAELAAFLAQLAETTGLAREKHWAIALPDEATRTYIIPLDNTVRGHREVEDMLVWKIERLVGAPIAELRISHCPLSSVGGQQRFLVTITREVVIREYESLLSRVGWHAGLIWPRPIGEALWLNHPNALPNQILLTTSGDEYTVLILRHQEPVLLRTQTVTDEDVADSLHRLLLFYRDRAGEIIPGVAMVDNPLASTLFEVLVVGNWGDRDSIRDRVREAFGVQPVMVSSELLGFSPSTMKADFSQVAAAAGLASLSTL